MLLVILSLVCIVATVCVALLVGSTDATLFDFSNLNFTNMIPALIIGGFISCVVVGITVLFVARSLFLKFRDYFLGTKDNGGSSK